MRILTSTFLVVSIGGVASANGFYINEHDAKVTGRAGASAASDTDASSVIFNPAGLALSDGMQASIGSSLIIANGRYTDLSNQSTDTDSGPAVLPSLFLSKRLNKMFAAGVGFHLPFGLALSWPANSPQADISLKSELRTYFLTASGAINLEQYVPGLSAGAGLDFVPATVELEQAVIFGDPNNGGTVGNARLGGSAMGFGFRAGAMYQPPSMKELKIGATYRSQINLDFTGTGDFDIAAPYRSQLPPDGDISTTLKLPMSATLGVAYRPTPQLEVEVDAVWINWSAFESIDVTLPDMTHQVSAQNYDDTVTLRLGVEYQVNDKAAVRAGYIYDPTPVPASTISARLPDADRNDVTLGGSYNLGNYDLHLGLLAVLPSKKSAADTMYQPLFKGTYEVTAFVASLNLSAKFGK